MSIKSGFSDKHTVFTIVLSALIVFSAIIVSARVNILNLDIATSYGPGQLLEGSLDLRLSAEPANSEIVVSIERGDIETRGTFSLLEIIRNSGVNFSCDPANCRPVYDLNNPSKTISLSSGERYFGFLIKDGKEVQINSLSFDIRGKGSAESCGVNPAEIDLLSDGENDWIYSRTGGYCDSLSPSKTYEPSESEAKYKLGEIPYCEKIKLKKSNRFKVGADFVDDGSNFPIIMSIHDLSTGEGAECDFLPGDGASNCEVVFPVREEKEYYVCVQSSDESNYLLRGETKSPNCGHFGLEEFTCDESGIDYAIYTQPAAFGVFNGTEAFNAEVFLENTQKDLVSYVQEYIDENYGANCEDECIIPVEANLVNQIEISNLNFRYTTDLGVVDESDVYPLDKEEARVTSANYTKLQLSSLGFNVPSIYGTYDLFISFGEEDFRERIRVERVPQINAVTPTTVQAEVETEFSASVTSPDNNTIVSYFWDFGDGITGSSTTPFIKHTYPLGNFALSLTVTDNKGLSSTKSFSILTLQPREAVMSILAAKKGNLEKLVADVNNIPAWYSEIVKRVLNVQKISSDLLAFESEASSPSADYSQIKLSLDRFPVYTGIRDEDLGVSSPIAAVEISYLEKLGEPVPFERREEIASSIRSWQAENIVISVSGTVKKALADTGAENNLDLATVLRITISSADGAPKEKVFFVMKLPSGVSYEEARFNTNGTLNLGDAVGIIFDRVESSRVELALPGRVNPADLEVFATTSLDRIAHPEVRCGNLICEAGFGESYDTCPSDCRRPLTGPIIYSALIIILLALGIYVIWKYYAAYYEKKIMQKLFSRDEDFYSLTFFIASELNKGTKEEKIRKDLEKAEWSKDQINYGLKKVKEQTKSLQKQSILNFTSDELKAGKNEDEISGDLKEAGWSPKLIKWALKKAKKRI